MATRTRVSAIPFESDVLRDNPLGDPWVRDLHVLLPPDYERDAGRRYPVVVGLTGFSGRGANLLNVDAWQPNLPERLDRLYQEGMAQAIVVLPDCFTKLAGSQYVNSSAVGRYEDYVVEEIVPFVDAEFRSVGLAEGRAIFGKSSGGYGAFMLGMKHPDVFGALACHSGDMAFDLCYKPDFPKFCNTINKAGGVQQWWEQFAGKVKKTNDDFAAINVFAMAACYSPDPGAFMGVGLPFDTYTCELKPDVWQRWLEYDPIQLAPRYADNLRSLRLLYMDCGNRDEFNLHFGARQMSKLLNQLDVSHTYEEFDDGHMSIQYRYSDSLPRLLGALVEGNDRRMTNST